ncbi:MAG: ABC transporter permease [Planctomycetota bacterium]
MQILSLALKDLKLLLRDRTAAFFILAFPVLMGLFFGMMMSGTSDDNRGKISIAVVDQDTTDLSRAFVKALANNSSLAVLSEDLDAAKESVRKGSMTGMLVIPQGFHQTAGIFWEPSPELQLGVDPSRTAEGAMLEGFVMQAMSELIQHRLRNPDAFLPSIAKAREDFAASPELDPLTRQLGSAMFAALEQFIGRAKLQPATGTSETSASEIVEGGFQLARVRRLDVTTKTVPSQLAVQTAKLRSQWDISFPQAMLWGVLGCVAGFAISIARERSAGTLQRLLASPLSLQRILLGKALACFLASLFVIGLLTVLGVALKMRPESYPKLAAAAVCTAFCFVGIMMTISVLGKTEQSVGGVGWAINLVMAMIGGCMVPVMFMPEFIQRIGVLSPVRWAIVAIEGAVWRQFTWSEMAWPCLILLGIGLAGFALGNFILQRSQAGSH